MQNSWKLSREDKDDAVSRHAAGETVADLAAAYRVGKECIYGILRRRGVQFTHPGPGRRKVEDREGAVRMYQEGASLHDVASHYTVSDSAVLAWLKRAGVPCRAKRSRTPKQQARVNYVAHVCATRGIGITSFIVAYRTARGRCEVCQSRLRIGEGVCVDHCHTTGKIRGILCRRCNQGLGCFLDRLGLLSAAMGYLSRSRVQGMSPPIYRKKT